MEMEKINILHIYQNSKIGGVQQQLFSLLKTYNREVFNPFFCCLGPKEEMGTEIEKLGIDFIALNSKRYHKFSPKIMINLYQLMKKRHIHVVRAHKYRASLYGRVAAFFARIPVVITSVHGNYRKDLRPERRIANRILSRVTDKIVAVSESIKEDIIRYDKIDPSKILVIHNGVDILKFAPDGRFHDIRKEFAITDSDVVIGFIGRLVPAKGIEYLIDAFSHLVSELKNIKLLIVGQGSLLDRLRERTHEHGINGSVLFTGERHDIPDILSGIDIFVMPSVAEGLPNSLLEAMAMRKPIIATSVGGIPEVIRNGINGLLVPPRNAESIITAIKKLLDKRHLAKKMGQSARYFVEENLSIQATTRKWESLYISLLKEKRALINSDISDST
jgi:glycosyltransferase involved in cell wall biosynthesis